MTDAQVLEIIAGAFDIALKIAGPILGTALAIGVVVSLLQTVTQIQEMTLSFVPKLLGTGAIVLVSGQWMLRTFVTWVESLWALIPTI